MKTRSQLAKKARKNQDKIKALESENYELLKQSYLLSDKKQQFTEQLEDILVCGRPKIYEKKMIGKIHWEEEFEDLSTGKKIKCKRVRTVRVNGVWSF